MSQGFRSADWTAAVDRILADVAGVTDAVAAERWGISETTVRRWRNERAEGAAITGEVRGRPRRALLRAMEGAVTKRGANQARRGRSREQRTAVEPDHPHDLERALLDALGAAREAEPWVQLEILREISAIKRAISAEHESRAAELRAEALLEDARAYNRRIDERRSEEGTDRIRRLIHEAVQTGRVPPDLFRGAEVPDDVPAAAAESIE